MNNRIYLFDLYFNPQKMKKEDFSKTVNKLYDVYGIDMVDKIYLSALDHLKKHGNALYNDYLKQFKIKNSKDAREWFNIDTALMMTEKHFKDQKLN